MRQTARRQRLDAILGDMGIVVWRLRSSAEARRESDSSVAVQNAGEPVVEAVARPAAQSVVELPGSVLEPTAAAPTAAAPEPEAPAAPAAGPVAEPWSALSLAQGGALLLVPADASKRDLRLAQDLVAAASGDFGGQAVARRFDWPPDMRLGEVAADAASGRRAFAAFVAKDVADHGVRVVLAVESLEAELAADALPGCRRLIIADLGRLGQDEAAKRALWQRLGDPEG